MATMIGKIFVLANVVLSLLMATLAIGVYTNRVDWPGTATAVGGEKPQGEVARRKAEVDDAGRAAGVALHRWETASDRLTRLEKARPELLARYDQELAILEGQDSAGKPLNDPAQILVPAVNAQGQPLLDENGFPALQKKAPARPLSSRRGTIAEQQQLEKEIQAQMASFKDVVQKEKEQTEEINGIKGEQKGLRDLLAEELTARRNAQGELDYLRPFRYNHQVEAALLQKRKMQLEARKKELEGGLASRLP